MYEKKQMLLKESNIFQQFFELLNLFSQFVVQYRSKLLRVKEKIIAISLQFKNRKKRKKIVGYVFKLDIALTVNFIKNRTLKLFQR